MATGKLPFVYIVTGTTRGIGKALAAEILRRGHRLCSLSRAADAVTGEWRNYHCDLRDPECVQAVMGRLLDEIDYERCADAILINNAGVLTPIGPLDTADPSGMQASLQVNLMAPMRLMALFIRAAGRVQGDRRIINITSGAGRHPYFGWGLYCAAKAAVNMLTRCTALEQRSRSDPVSVCAVEPGVVATDMQGDIRQANDRDFPDRPSFVRLAESGGLLAPEAVARLILELDAASQFQSGQIYDLRRVAWLDGRPTIAPQKENG
ncbi:MAG: SDR family NAD(P)-dependent oxidoreductase [Desulfatitalea sp.]|nr:SDR family NAD(P)-dependent oxidoreductase [Desulfatitalea sp.]